MDTGQPYYRVDYSGNAVLRPSLLGLLFRQQSGLDCCFEVTETVANRVDHSWEQPWGERRYIRDRHNELLVRYRSLEPPQREFLLRIRAFDDGIGFRYEVPRQPNYRDLEIVEELTQFHLAAGADSEAWWIPGRRFNRYEYLYNTSHPDSIETAHTPMTVRLDNGIHISIHEAALVNYAAYVLDQRRPNIFETNLTPWSDGIRVRTGAPFVTPWRTIQIAPDAPGLINSDLILNLNEPNMLGDVSWVRPAKYIGIWWAMHIGARTWASGEQHGATTKETMRYVDFAAEHGFDGVLVEGWNLGWDGDWFFNGDLFSFTESYPDFDLPAVSRYARDKGVQLIGHHETSGSISNYERQMNAAYDLYAAVGVDTIKTGYVADGGDIKWVDRNGVAHYEWHDGQFMVDHHLRAVQQAAMRKISLNPHEPIKDTGLRRTYPNWLTREGVRGQEFNAWGDPPNTPEHTAIIPYTRMLSGPADFTPGIFDLTFKGAESKQRVRTTLAKQLALYVVLYSPLQMAADLPENYLRHPEMFQFIKDVPVDWEDSIAVAGEVGDFVVIARKDRHSNDWYLGALSDEDARTLEIPLDFLPAGRDYDLTVYADGPDAHWETRPYDYRIDSWIRNSADSLRLRLAAGGGTAVRFTPRN